MCQGAGVEDDGQNAARTGFVQPINEVAFVVGLAQIDFEPHVGGLILQRGGDAVERVMAIYFRFTTAKQVEVGAIEHENEI